MRGELLPAARITAPRIHAGRCESRTPDGRPGSLTAQRSIGISQQSSSYEFADFNIGRDVGKATDDQVGVIFQGRRELEIALAVHAYRDTERLRCEAMFVEFLQAKADDLV